MKRLTLTADGSCLGNPGPGGWAWVYDADVWAAGGHYRTTNNLMELRAVHELLTSVPTRIPLAIQTDSTYVINVFTQWLPGWVQAGWRTRGKKPVANRSAIELIAFDLQNRDVEWTHVRGHSGHTENELADTFARQAAQALKVGRPVPRGDSDGLKTIITELL